MITEMLNKMITELTITLDILLIAPLAVLVLAVAIISKELKSR